MFSYSYSYKKVGWPGRTRWDRFSARHPYQHPRRSQQMSMSDVPRQSSVREVYLPRAWETDHMPPLLRASLRTPRLCVILLPRLLTTHHSQLTTHYSLSTPTFLLPAAATVIRFPTGNSEESSEPSRPPRSSSVSLRLGGPPQHAHRPYRSSRRARPNKNRPLLPGKNVYGQFQSSRLPLSIAP
jgi:hypothetical protein